MVHCCCECWKLIMLINLYLSTDLTNSWRTVTQASDVTAQCGLPQLHYEIYQVSYSTEKPGDAVPCLVSCSSETVSLVSCCRACAEPDQLSLVLLFSFISLFTDIHRSRCVTFDWSTCPARCWRWCLLDRRKFDTYSVQHAVKLLLKTVHFQLAFSYSLSFDLVSTR